MNPSSTGWLKKLMKFATKNSAKISTLSNLYPSLKSAGFVYGSNISTAIVELNNNDFTQEERCKINFTLALLSVYNCSDKKETDFETALKLFYKSIEFHKPNFIKDLIGSDIEAIIHKRIQAETNIFSKTFSLFVTNALLFMDVLAFEVFLRNRKNVKIYLINLENSIRTVVSKAFNSKTTKNTYDKSLIKLLESSLRISSSNKRIYEQINSDEFSSLELCYLLDLACMATWSDQKIDAGIEVFFKNFGAKFKFTETAIIKANIAVNEFYKKYENDISLLCTQNIAERFYHRSSSIVKKLISRNSKRLYQELKESKDLVKLVSESTVRNLNKEEQQQMHEQMMDLIKSIPSLAIFMLPGGAVLLPLFIKLVPKLLPSAFDENRIEDE